MPVTSFGFNLDALYSAFFPLAHIHLSAHAACPFLTDHANLTGTSSASPVQPGSYSQLKCKEEAVG